MHTIARTITCLILVWLLALSMWLPAEGAVRNSSGNSSVGNTLPPQLQPGGYPQVASKSAILMDQTTGRVLFDKNVDEELPPASVTKMMTALLVVEDGHLDEQVIVTPHAATTGESTIWLQPGEVLTRRQLLYAMMLHSANDAAVALAESVAITEGAFIDQMNRRARQLHLRHTHFINPHGLEATGHYSSAYDLAQIARVGLDNPDFRAIVSTQNINITWAGHPWMRHLWNQNRMLYRYKGTIGIKTGYTKKAGNCVVCAVQRNGLTLIAVSLNSPQVYVDLEGMFDYGFAHYRGALLKKASQVTARVPVSWGQQATVLVKADRDLVVATTPAEERDLSVRLFPASGTRAPVHKGDRLGSWRIYLKGKDLARGNMLASTTVARRPTFWSNMIAWISSCLHRIF